MARIFCPYCGRVHKSGTRCACREQPKRKPTSGDKTRGKREPWRKDYSDPEYQRNRQIVIELQQGHCKDCNTICAVKKNGKWVTVGHGGEVDHEVPLCEGGTNEVGNLALRCKSCHGLADAKRRKRRKRR